MKDTFIAYIRPKDGAVKDVMLMDAEFSVKSGLSDTVFRNGLLISNLSRYVFELFTANDSGMKNKLTKIAHTPSISCQLIEHL